MILRRRALLLWNPPHSPLLRRQPLPPSRHLFLEYNTCNIHYQRPCSAANFSSRAFSSSSSSSSPSSKPTSSSPTSSPAAATASTVDASTSTTTVPTAVGKVSPVPLKKKSPTSNSNSSSNSSRKLSPAEEAAIEEREFSKIPRSSIVSFKFVGDDGYSKLVHAAVGTKMLDVAKTNCILRIPGICGGKQICSTCHVILDKQAIAAIGPAIHGKEIDMLDCAPGATNASRLACQFRVTKSMQGCQITIPNSYLNQQPQPKPSISTVSTATTTTASAAATVAAVPRKESPSKKMAVAATGKK